MVTLKGSLYYSPQLSVFHTPFHAAEQHRICRIRSLNCLSTPVGHKLREFLNSRQIRAAQGSLPLVGQVNGCTFFAVQNTAGSFLYTSKEMNIKLIKANMI